LLGYAWVSTLNRENANPPKGGLQEDLLQEGFRRQLDAAEVSAHAGQVLLSHRKKAGGEHGRAKHPVAEAAIEPVGISCLTECLGASLSPNTVHLRRIRLCPAAETNRRGTDGADDCSLSEQYSS
jgi:hypothetical protein